MPRPRREAKRRLFFTKADEILLEILEAGGEIMLNELIRTSKLGRVSIYKYYPTLVDLGLLEKPWRRLSAE